MPEPIFTRRVELAELRRHLDAQERFSEGPQWHVIEPRDMTVWAQVNAEFLARERYEHDA